MKNDNKIGYIGIKYLWLGLSKLIQLNTLTLDLFILGLNIIFFSELFVILFENCDIFFKF